MGRRRPRKQLQKTKKKRNPARPPPPIPNPPYPVDDYRQPQPQIPYSPSTPPYPTAPSYSYASLSTAAEPEEEPVTERVIEREKVVIMQSIEFGIYPQFIYCQHCGQVGMTRVRKEQNGIFWLKFILLSFCCLCCCAYLDDESFDYLHSCGKCGKYIGKGYYRHCRRHRGGFLSWNSW